MGIVDDVLKALDRIPIWKRLGDIPTEVDELRRRVSGLEEKLASKWPADVCRYCGDRAARLDRAYPATDKGIIHEDWKCGACGEFDRRSYKASGR
jgi:hypothetical protein